MIAGPGSTTSAITWPAGKSSPGLLVVAQGTPIGAAAEAIVTMWAVTTPGELTNQAYHLPSLINHSFPR